MAAITQIASLSDVKSFLQVPTTDTQFDTMLTNVFIPAATRAVEREVGHIISKTIFAERHSGGTSELWLRELPVLYVQNVEEGWGYFNEELVLQQVNTQPALSFWSYSVDIPSEGRVTRRGPGNVVYPFVQGVDNIRVDYVVGRQEIPDNVPLVFHALLSYWFRQWEERLLTGIPAPGDVLNTDFTRKDGYSSVNLGIPDSIIELLKPDRRRPIIG